MSTENPTHRIAGRQPTRYQSTNGIQAAATVRAARSDVTFQGSLLFADAEARVTGNLLHVHRRAAVELQVEVKKARVENVVQRASGRSSARR